jgi:hypothetical protein
VEDVRRLEALAEHLDSCFDELLSECSLACAARVRVETLACADRLEVVDPDCENFIGKEDGLLEGIQRNRACRRIGVLMPSWIVGWASSLTCRTGPSIWSLPVGSCINFGFVRARTS